MMDCPVCGQSYGLTHNCPGAVAAAASEPEAAPPSGFEPSYYFLEAWRIARFDDAAIRTASRDSRALWYGLSFEAVVFALSFTKRAIMSSRAMNPLGWVVLPFILGAFFIGVVLIQLLEWAICHFLARWLFKGSGTFLGIARPLLLAQIIGSAALIPYVGTAIAGLWGIAILMVVFEEVEGIARMKAFLLAWSVGLIFWISFILLFHRPPT